MKVVICGAGIAGLTLANRISVLGGDVVLLERTSGPRSQGYMIDFFGPGYDAAEAMGLLPAIEAVAYPVDEVSLVDPNGHRRAGIPYELLRNATGGRLLTLMRPDLEKVLRDNLPADVDQRFGTTPVGIADHSDRVRITLDDGGELEADVLIGADGVHSTVRELVFGDESKFLRYLGFHTAAFLFDAPHVRDVTDGRIVLTDTAGRQMGFYALRDRCVAAFAVGRASDPALPDDVRAAIRDTYRDLGWLVPEALAECPPSKDVYYDQVAQIEMPSWSKGRVTLVGDACYAVSLLAGQGASLGVAGAYVLADALTTSRRSTGRWRNTSDSGDRWPRRSRRSAVPPPPAGSSSPMRRCRSGYAAPCCGAFCFPVSVATWARRWPADRLRSSRICTGATGRRRPAPKRVSGPSCACSSALPSGYTTAIWAGCWADASCA